MHNTARKLAFTYLLKNTFIVEVMYCELCCNFFVVSPNQCHLTAHVDIHALITCTFEYRLLTT